VLFVSQTQGFQFFNADRPTAIISGPSRATAGPGKTLSRGPVTRAHSVCLEIETPKASTGRKRGERCPLTIRSGVRGNVVNSPSGVRAEPRPKMDFMHILGQKEAIWNIIFSIFERWRGPQTSRGPGKLSPSPSRRACRHLAIIIICTLKAYFVLSHTV